MIGKGKKTLITILTIALLSFPFLQNNVVYANEKSKPSHTVNHKNELSTKLVLNLAQEWNKVSNYVQRGGDYKKGEYKSFSYKGKTYRYLSSSIDTKRELLSYLGKVLDRSAAEQYMKNHGILEYKGKLFQLEADGGSLLQWEKATAQYVKSEKNTKFYRVTVPVGNTVETQDYSFEYKYVNKVGWRISKEPTKLEPTNVLTDKLVVELATKFSIAESYVSAGGSYGKGEYKTFIYNGKTYRFLSSDIDTKDELLSYLKQSMTQSVAEKFIEKRALIVYQGKLAQLEADGGSIAKWANSKVEFIKSENNTKFYRLIVPIGNRGDVETYMVEYQFVDKVGWRVSNYPFWDLEIPGNVNPAFIFFKYLLVDSKVAKEQFIDASKFNVDEFKKGINKVEFMKMVEIDRGANQVEFLVKFKVELDKNYKGSLVNGENAMYFYIKPTGYMTYKIDRVGKIVTY